VTRLPRPLVVALAVLGGLVPYVGSVRYGFTLDDANTIGGHKGVRERLSFTDIVLRDWWGRSRFDTIGTWRPFATLTFWVDQHVGGGHAWPFHVTNLLLYGALLVLLERFLFRWCGPALAAPARAVAVVVYGTLAIHADVVPSPTGRAELLAALFSLAALFAATCTPTLGVREAALASGCLFLALLSKESAAPMAILVPLLSHRMHFERRTLHRGAILGLALAAPIELGAVAAFRMLAMPFMQLGPDRAPENPLLAVDAPRRLVGALDVLGLYLRHLVTGLGLAPDYSFSEPPILRAGALGIALGGGTLLACAALVVACWRRAPRTADAALAFGASYLTVSNLVVAASAIADRLFFFPSMWLVVIGALLASEAARTRAAQRAACAMALVFAGVQAARATAYAALWRDDATLFTAAARAYPDVFRTQRNLAHALSDAHQDAAAAWHLAIAEAIFARYPVPTARDEIDPAWDDEPLRAELAHLRTTFGAHPACAAVERAQARLTSWEDPTAAALLAGWSRETCAP
jgi:hypothetical protein